MLAFLGLEMYFLVNVYHDVVASVRHYELVEVGWLVIADKLQRSLALRLPRQNLGKTSAIYFHVIKLT